MNDKKGYNETRLNVEIKLADTPPNSTVKSPQINIKIRANVKNANESGAIDFDIFEVPKDIVDINTNLGTCTGDSCSLDKYIAINIEKNPQELITVNNGNSNDIWKLKSLIQDAHLNIIKA